MAGNDRNHVEWLNSQLPHWQDKGWITSGAAEAMRTHYGDAQGSNLRRMTSILLAILAALLIGGGVILIFAYNWEDLSRPLRAVISIAPLIATYVFGYHVLKNTPDSAAMREGAAIGNMCALAAAIALVGQTYNIPGDLTSFLTSVCLLSLPAIYLFRSQGAAFFYLAGIVWHRWDAYEYFQTSANHAYLIFWGMLALVIPYLVMQIRAKRYANVRWLTFFMLCAVAIGMNSAHSTLWSVLCSYALLCSSIIGLKALDDGYKYIEKTAAVFAYVGLFIIIMITSFGDTWKEAGLFNDNNLLPAAILLSVLGAINLTVLYATIRKQLATAAIWTALGPLFIIVRLLYSGHYIAGNAALVLNAIGFAAGLSAMGIGYKTSRAGQVNFGLAVISGICLMRFFDSDMSMLARGFCFIAIGILFVVVNVKISRAFKKEKQS